MTSSSATPGSALADLMRGTVSIGSALGLDVDELARIAALGRAHLAAGRAKDARAIFDGLCALEPHVATFHQLVAMAAEAAGDLPAADAAFTRSIVMGADARPAAGPGQDHERGAAYVSRGLVRMKLGRHSEALADFALADALCDPSDAVLAQTLRVMRARCADVVAAAVEGG